MKNVVNLFKSQNNLVTELENLTELARAGKLKTIMIAGHLNDDTVVTGYQNLDILERQTLIANLQLDVNLAVIAYHLGE